MAYASFFEDNNLLNLLNLNPADIYSELFFKESGNNYKNLLLSDYKFYLPEMMMLKVDRSSMANSLEVRSPFVDHKLVEYVLSTESSFMDSGPKSLLKKYPDQQLRKIIIFAIILIIFQMLKGHFYLIQKGKLRKVNFFF